MNIHQTRKKCGITSIVSLYVPLWSVRCSLFYVVSRHGWPRCQRKAHLLAAHATRSAWRHHAPAFSTVQRTPPARSMRWTTARARQTGNARDRRLSPGVNAVVAMPLRTSALRWQPCSNGLCATARRRRRPMCPIRVAPLCSTTDGHDNMGDSTVEIDAVDGVEPSANAGGVGKVSFDASAWSGLLEPLVQQVAVSLRERCDVRDGDSVRKGSVLEFRSSL